ncbi:MAG TPA: adenylosuccinate lyase [Candidatus Tectomicrobia bacterium]|nr:adenylosuccinate lyase [Candidatus Tectomicrobia bacterium]
MSDYQTYENPLGLRYASREMLYNFSAEKKFRTWRRLWVALAEAEQELGLPITEAQLEELRAHQDGVNYAVAEAYERQVRHDVMAHIYAYGQQCPTAKGIIHLGATSAYVTDNTDLIQMRDGLLLLRAKLRQLIADLAAFATRYKDLATLGYTHFQPAQLTTVGKRACLWLQDLVMDYDALEHARASMRFRGVKGTTGTQASFLELFAGDHVKVQRLDAMVTERLGFGEAFPITGQTYPRKQDSQVLHLLSEIAASAHKFSSDIRLLQSVGEMEEPFEEEQVGSSAMAYKRNPMRCERIAGLARYVMTTALNAPLTAATQWFERTLDDSSNRRLLIPEAFLATDAVLRLYINVVRGLTVYPAVITRRIQQELPFMATEALLMAGVKAGGDRQLLHERLRVHSMAAAQAVKEGHPNDLTARVAGDPAFAAVKGDLSSLLAPMRFVGRAPQQVEDYLTTIVDPLLQQSDQHEPVDAEVHV